MSKSLTIYSIRFICFDIVPVLVIWTDGQTDRQKCYNNIAHCMLTRDKNQVLDSEIFSSVSKRMFFCESPAIYQL